MAPDDLRQTSPLPGLHALWWSSGRGICHLGHAHRMTVKTRKDTLWMLEMYTEEKWLRYQTQGQLEQSKVDSHIGVLPGSGQWELPREDSQNPVSSFHPNLPALHLKGSLNSWCELQGSYAELLRQAGHAKALLRFPHDRLVLGSQWVT